MTNNQTTPTINPAASLHSGRPKSAGFMVPPLKVGVKKETGNAMDIESEDSGEMSSSSAVGRYSVHVTDEDGTEYKYTFWCTSYISAMLLLSYEVPIEKIVDLKINGRAF